MPAKGPLQSVQVFGRKVSKLSEFIPRVLLSQGTNAIRLGDVS